MTHYANRESPWFTGVRTTGLCTSLRSSSLVLQNCYSAKNRALLYLDFSFTDSPPFFLTERLLCEKTDLLHLNFLFTDCIFPRLAEPFLWQWHLPFFIWSFPPLILSPMFQQNCYPAKTQPLYYWIFFGLMTILEHYLKEKVVIKNVKNFNHHDLCSPN